MRTPLACSLLPMALGVLCINTALSGQNGYSIQNGKVIVNTSEHWSQWQTVAKTIQITDEGVQPTFIRKNTTVEIDGAKVLTINDEYIYDLWE